MKRLHSDTHLEKFATNGLHRSLKDLVSVHKPRMRFMKEILKIDPGGLVRLYLPSDSRALSPAEE